MLLACSHLVIATADVPRMTRFFSAAFALEPHFANDLFAEFVLASDPDGNRWEIAQTPSADGMLVNR